MFPNLFRVPEWVPLLGGEVITSFGVMMFLAFLTAGLVHSHEMKRVGFDPEYTWTLVFWAVIGGIGGAKLYYLLLNFPRLVADPLAMILSRGGLVWYGGFLTATAMVVWQIHRLRLPLGRTADTIAPALAISYAVGRVGCFLVGDDYGRPTASPLGIRFPRGTPPTRVNILEDQFGIEVDPALVERFGDIVPVHPTQLYEIAASLVIFFVLWRLRGHARVPGWLFMLYLSLAGLERFAVEFFRAKDDRFFGTLTLAQLISLAIVTVGLAGVARLRRAAPAPGRSRRAAAR